MFYPVYKNGPFVVIPLESDLGIEWKLLKEEEVSKVTQDLEFDLVLSEEDKFICMIDIREDNNVFLVNNRKELFVLKSIRRPLKFKSVPYELVMYRESIDSIKDKGRDYVKNLLHDTLFDLLNKKMEQEVITVDLHSSILKDYENTLNACVLK